MPLQEPLPPEIEEEARKQREAETKKETGGDKPEEEVKIESVPVGQAKTLNKNESQKSVKAGAAAGGRDSSMKPGAKPTTQQQQ